MCTSKCWFAKYMSAQCHIDRAKCSGAASSISEGAIFIYSCSGQLSSFEIKSISKELNCPEHEYMNMAPSLIELAAPLAKCISGPPPEGSF